MLKDLFINIHTHSTCKKGEWAIQNIHTGFNNLPSLPFSAGLHPWYITKDSWKSAFNEVKKTCTNDNLLALGECGLDKVCNTDYALQKEVFKTHVLLANQIEKPLIVHCVRAHDDVMEILAEVNNNMPVIFHGFNKNLAIAEKIIKKGYYLSFGKDLLKESTQHTFANIPAQYIFLETDDSNLNIENIYETAAAIRHISLETLSLQLKQNVYSVFNITV